jgi:hypothetical protein
MPIHPVLRVDFIDGDGMGGREGRYGAESHSVRHVWIVTKMSIELSTVRERTLEQREGLATVAAA